MISCSFTSLVDTRRTPRDRWGFLVKAIVEVFCARWTPGAAILGVRDSRRNIVHLNSKALAALGVTLDSAAKIPDIIVHDPQRNWLLLIEAVTSAGPVDGKRRKEPPPQRENRSAATSHKVAAASRSESESPPSEIHPP